MSDLLPLAALLLVALGAACDIRTFEIPDWIPASVLLLYVPHVVLNDPPGMWYIAILVALSVFGIGALLFRVNAMGGGDVKLLTVCALWAGLPGLAPFLAGTTISGGLLAFAAIGGRWIMGARATYPSFRKDGPLPYAVAILMGFTLAMRPFL